MTKSTASLANIITLAPPLVVSNSALVSPTCSTSTGDASEHGYIALLHAANKARLKQGSAVEFVFCGVIESEPQEEAPRNAARG